MEERVKKLQTIADRHEESLDHISQQIDQERQERREGDSVEQQQRQELRKALEERISIAAAGGLSLETWGVVFFALGVVLGCRRRLNN